jgi:hypothetical protein
MSPLLASFSMVVSGWLLCAPSLLLAASSDIKIEAGITADNNVSRSGDPYRLNDQIYSLALSKGFDFPLSEHTRLLLLGVLGGEKFRTHTGLSRFYYGFQSDIQYRASGEFTAPIFGAFVRGFKDQYESDLRDGYRYSAGVTASKPVTDRMQLFGALAYNVRNGNNTVFNNNEWSARLNLDYALTQSGTVYLNGEYHRGDTVSSAPDSDAYEQISTAKVQDDAFPGLNRWAYRVTARTTVATLGYNVAIGDRQALDFSWRWVQSTPTAMPSIAVPENYIRYIDNQFRVAYLVRF